jgi:hypothetical protein
MLSEVVYNIIRIYARILLSSKNFRSVILVLARHLIDTLISAISDIHEIFKSEAWFAEVLVSLIATILGYV